MFTRPRLLSRTIPIVCVLTVLWSASTDSAGRSTRRYCVSCPQGIANQFDFAEISLGVPVSHWFTVDLEGDGLWEIAIRTSETPTRVGVFDPRLGEWIDGPHAIPVVGDEWGARDRDHDGVLEYVYRNGRLIRHYDPAISIDSLLWTDSNATTAVRSLFWGQWPSGSDVVALLYGGQSATGWGWNWLLKDLWSGERLPTYFPGEPSGARRVHGYPHPADQYLVLHATSTYIYPEPHVGYQICRQSIKLLDKKWNVVLSEHLREERVSGGGPPLGPPGMTHAAIAFHGPSSQHMLVWQASSPQDWAGYYFSPNAGAEWITGGYLWERSCEQLEHCLARSAQAKAVAYDLNMDGTEEVLAPDWRDSSWQVWDPLTGTLDTTIPNCPVAKLDAATLFRTDKRALFYLADSTLYIYHPDINTGILDFPDALTPETAACAAIIAVPNPFNSDVALSWSSSAPVPSLAIFNILGQRVRTLRLPESAGEGQSIWDARDDHARPVASGIYFARLEGIDQPRTTQLVLLR